MARITLLRHAKAKILIWLPPISIGAGATRPSQCRRMGVSQENGLLPQLIILSPSARTRQTHELPRRIGLMSGETCGQHLRSQRHRGIFRYRSPGISARSWSSATTRACGVAEQSCRGAADGLSMSYFRPAVSPMRGSMQNLLAYQPESGRFCLCPGSGTRLRVFWSFRPFNVFPLLTTTF